MNFWIIKTEPTNYSFDDLKRDKRTSWDGVRNYQARNNIKNMKIGDLALVYHSVGPKELVGIAKIISTAYNDATDSSGLWSAIDVKYVCALKTPLKLAAIKASPKLCDLALVKQGRLSVAPLKEEEWRILLEMAHSTI
jgi:predicted RNA-binding protein with PUA-like domain